MTVLFNKLVDCLYFPRYRLWHVVRQEPWRLFLYWMEVTVQQLVRFGEIMSHPFRFKEVYVSEQNPAWHTVPKYFQFLYLKESFHFITSHCFLSLMGWRKHLCARQSFYSLKLRGTKPLE
jgi:hypothetical protein